MLDGIADNERIRLAALLASCVANLSKATGKVLRMPALPANVRYRQYIGKHLLALLPGKSRLRMRFVQSHDSLHLFFVECGPCVLPALWDQNLSSFLSVLLSSMPDLTHVRLGPRGSFEINDQLLHCGFGSPQ
jgi:hypothetical protein